MREEEERRMRGEEKKGERQKKQGRSLRMKEKLELDNNFMREDYRSETLLPKIITVDIRDWMIHLIG